ncbi:MAG: rhomboid family intramembrane serine protease [Verrucomicrobia subdivision 3 bacterium]|nr:rhomboid family intramembrane serine protease [Limisphaerales bacterium]
MLFLFPVGVDYRAQRYPVVTFTLMGLNVVIYLVSLVLRIQSSGNADDWITQHLWLKPSESTWYTYITALFVHAGFFHLLWNMVYLFLFGSCVEDIIGRTRYIAFYLLGGLAADFAHIAATPDHFKSDIPLVGASGAINACIGGFVLLLHKIRVNFRYVIFLIVRAWTGDFWLPAWLVISFWFLIDVLFAAMSFVNENVGGGVAFAAHVGGFLAGLGMIGAYKAYLRMRPPEEAGELVEEAASGAMDQPAVVYLFESGNQSGPFTLEQINQMIAIGAISAETLYWQEGMEEWRAVAELTE